MTDPERRAKLRMAIDLLMDVLALDTPLPEVAGTPIGGPLLDMSTVAERLKLSPSTVYRLARAGTLPSVKLGSAWRFEPRAVEDYIRAAGRGTQPDTAA